MRIENEQGFFDTYNFDYQSGWSNTVRNAATLAGWLFTGPSGWVNGEGYEIHGYGKANVTHKQPEKIERNDGRAGNLRRGKR